MARGTFANIRLFNKFLNKQAPQTVHLPSGETVSPPPPHPPGSWEPGTFHRVCVSPQMDVFDAADRYQQSGFPLLILAGKEYGSGSSRDWAAKGPFLLVSFHHAAHLQPFCGGGAQRGDPCFQGIKAVIAESYERIHRSNLVGMGVIPLEYLPGDTAESLGLTGRERYTIVLPEKLTPRMVLQVQVCQARRAGIGTLLRCVTCSSRVSPRSWTTEKRSESG